MKIAVLFGGIGAEREVSLVSGRAVCAALRQRRHTVNDFDYANGLPDRAVLQSADAVFLALHGGAGEDGTLQEQLESIGVFHYTGSAPYASFLAMRKDLAKERVLAAGIPVARGGVIGAGQRLPDTLGTDTLIVKPLSGGSSVGFARIERGDPLPAFDCPMLWEEFLPGREYSVGLLRGGALPVVEIRPRGGLYDYEHKYTKGATEELCPAPLCAEKTAALQKAALQAGAVLGIRDYGRIDFKEDGRGVPCFLEANTLPGMTGESLLPLAAKTAGIPFGELCETMAGFAAERKKG